MNVAIIHNDLDVSHFLSYLLADSGHTVCWDSNTCAQALTHIGKLVPDLILLDLNIPDMPASEFIRKIMASTPTTIIVVCKSVHTNASKVFEAMSAGALDACTEPTADNPPSIQVVKRKVQNINSLHKASRTSTPAYMKSDSNLPLLAIGASTGGPAALVKVLSKISPSPHAVIVVVQHMDKEFSPGMAKWIDEQIKLKVEIARANHKPLPGIVYIASSDDHLILQPSGLFDYTAVPVDYPYRPSVDVFFESAVTNWPNKMIGVLLTGMGRDGANGLLSFYNRGMVTIAQNEASCAVFGMPKAAIALNAAQRVLHIDDIGDAINLALLTIEKIQ
jgi:two-component system, chemotaxis family, response regulator WspF